MKQITEVLATLKKDSLFLSQNSIIDYSLLLIIKKSQTNAKKGAEIVINSIQEDMDKYILDQKNRISPEVLQSLKDNQCYYFGIIDTLTYFGLKKRAEYLMKRTFQGKGISCIPPDQYQNRFMGFME